jgi:hypothetical protein
MLLLTLLNVSMAHPTMNLAKQAKPGSPNTLCIVQHCLVPLSTCLMNDACRQVVECSRPCDVSDIDCYEMCSLKYSSDAFDVLSACLVKNQCVVPHPRVEYPLPQSRLSPLSLEDAVGAWYVVAGYDKGVDCHPCQSISLLPYKDTQGVFKERLEIQFPHGKRVIESNMTNPVPGVWRLQYILTGVNGHDDWHVLWSDAAYALVYYIGETYFNSYRGIFLLARTPGPLDNAVELNVREALESSKIGIAYSDLCLLPQIPSECPNHA